VAYEEGFGVGKDYQEAAKLYRLAATNAYAGQGRAVAQFSLGVLYHEGHGVQRDWKEAVKWFELAADRGYTEAQFNAGWMYSAGEGVSEDLVKAYTWISLAQHPAAKSDGTLNPSDSAVAAKAKEVTAELAKKMKPEQLAAAEKIIKAWKPKTN